MKNTLAALVSFGSVIAATTAGGRHGPQRPVNGIWYASLHKPSYTPPGPAFGAAWTVLDGLLATAGYRLMTKPVQEVTCRIMVNSAQRHHQQLARNPELHQRYEVEKPVAPPPGAAPPPTLGLMDRIRSLRSWVTGR